MNVYHLYNKVPSVNLLLNYHNVHILGLSETKLDDKISDSCISINNYTIIRRDKQLAKHTGLAAYVHDSIYANIKIRHDLEHREIEALWLEIKKEKSIPTLICFIYRNPIETVEWQDHFHSLNNRIPYDKY